MVTGGDVRRMKAPQPPSGGAVGQGWPVLYIGGTGTISAACVRSSVAAGMTVYALNRGRNAKHRSLPESVIQFQADISDQVSVLQAIGDLEFGAVVNFLSYNAEDAAAAVAMFRGPTHQYIHISTASLSRNPTLQCPTLPHNPTHNTLATI